MSYEPIDDLPEQPDTALRAAMEPFECDHDFEYGVVCVDCGMFDADYDPTPHGAHLVTDPFERSVAA